MEDMIQQYVQGTHYRTCMKLPEEVTESYEMLAQGEYNRNYLFTHPVTGQKLILRVNLGSQMHLDHQIEYEYQALQILEASGRTPKVYYVDGTKKEIPYGVMVMEFLPGHAMEYKTELFRAADILSDIHSIPVEAETSLIEQENPLRGILEECEEMFAVYEQSDLGDAHKKRWIRELLKEGWKRVDALTAPAYRCCINTELNSTNFLIQESGSQAPDYLIDWEKPLYGEPAQDLGHFLAPTTTFWKTDVILTEAQVEAFIQTYIESVNGRFPTDGLQERVNVYIPVTCLRGITWCAMAWIQYQNPEKEVFNASTYKKLEAYLSDEFLEKIERFIKKQNI